MSGKNTVRQMWQERLQRFERAGLSVRAFCDDEGVSQASFYHWRRRLVEQRTHGTANTKPAFQAVRLTTVSAALVIELPGGTRVQVAADQIDLACAVVREVALVARGGA
jgi:transposase-like protein